MDYLTAEREFVGTDWFEYLLEQAHLEVSIRIRDSDKRFDGRKDLKAKVVFSALQVGQHQALRCPRRLWGHWGSVAALRLEDGKLLGVVSAAKPRQAIARYAARWSIETLFGIFKTRGFCLESTHLTDPERLSRWLALLTIALCWAFRTGEWLATQTPIVLKKHGRKLKSIFRTSLDYLRRIFLNLEQYIDEFSHALNFLSCT